jgi:hypothetical protein
MNFVYFRNIFCCKKKYEDEHNKTGKGQGRGEGKYGDPCIKMSNHLNSVEKVVLELKNLRLLKIIEFW